MFEIIRIIIVLLHVTDFFFLNTVHVTDYLRTPPLEVVNKE